jgi:hypothetical protein
MDELEGRKMGSRRDCILSAVISLIGMVLTTQVAMADPIDPGELRGFLEKKRPCYAWVFGVFNNALTAGKDKAYDNGVFCVFDGVRNEGGLREAGGCMVAIFDAGDMTYEPPKREVVAPGPCSRDALAILLDQNWLFGEAFVFPVGQMGEPARTEAGGSGGRDLVAAVCAKPWMVNSKEGTFVGAVQKPLCVGETSTLAEFSKRRSGEKKRAKNGKTSPVSTRK